MAAASVSVPASTAPIIDETQSFKRRDHLIDIEKSIQKQWETRNIFAEDASNAATRSIDDKYLATFPYPYMNGVLHLGHAFTITKADFQCYYQRLKGKKVLFPFGFHCTGMPISAAADKLRREIERFGNPPRFPAAVEEEKEEADNNTTDDKEEKDEKETKKDDAKSNTQPADKKRKVKAKLAKKTGKEVYQWNIMKGMGVPESEIAKFADAKYWLSYFPPIGRDHLKKFGVCVDFRRSFITTDVNPYYDSFVQWHFLKLRQKDKIAFGNRPAIFSPIDNQACADHDRSEGEGVGIADYTLIKVILQQPYPEALTKILSSANIPSTVSIVLPAATFRPETMYGQTNCWLLPDGEYGVYSMNDSEVFICAPRSALNMSYQGLTRVRGKPEEIGKIMGQVLMGCPIKSPHAHYEKMYILPLLTIKMDKGTGVVTSVPSDAPDDYQALQDLKAKKPLREKYHIKDEYVLPFEPVPIINTPGLGDLPAPSVCIEMKIQSQNDRIKLEEAKDKVYNLGFAKGEMKVGKYAGEKVMDAKGKIKQDMLDAKLALPYSEPMSRVVSRSGNECVVALLDQWYLKYGEEQWRNAIRSHVENTLDTYTEQAKSDFLKTIGWMHEWACSRSYGLGTRLPWDPQYLIESLSDSTIYMAYYAVSHLLQGGVLEGNVTGPAGITPDQLTEQVWDYIFIKDAPFPSSTTIPKETLDKLRNEFRYWYPMNLRVSGKDLINNHLTMSLYNHAAVWDNEPSLWPRSFFANGHVLVDKKKMSKSEGNFITLQQAILDFGADATRLALAEAGDGLDDANFEKKNANAAILRITKEEKFVEDVLADLKDGKLREGEMDFIDQVFDNEISKAIMDTDHNYSRMQYRYALKSGVFDLHISRDNYRIAQSKPFHKDLILRFIRVSTQLITPFCPHYAQHIWQLCGFNKETPFIIKAAWPQSSPINVMLMRKMNYIRSTNVMLRDSLNTAIEAIKKKNSKGKGPKESEQLNALVLFVVGEYKEWQQKVIAVVSKLIETAEKKLIDHASKEEQKETTTKSNELIDRKDLMAALRSAFQSELEADKEAAKIKGATIVPGMPSPGKFLEEAMKFSSQIIAEYAIVGAQALETRTPFNELEILSEHKSLIIRDIPVDESKVIFAPASDADAKYKQLFNVNVSAAKASPGKPAPVFFSSS